MFHKSRIYPFILVVLLIVVWQYRSSDKKELLLISGTTMGTTYTIKYLSPDDTNLKPKIDSILNEFNLSLSSYISFSELSRFNVDTVFYFESQYFLPVLRASRGVYEATNGAFDPTVLPLVNAWGFGPGEQNIPNKATVDSLKNYIGFDKVDFDDLHVSKSNRQIGLDFSAIAKGYGVDVVGDYLFALGIGNYFVEIGGEVICKGTNEGNMWRIGIEDPTRDIQQREIKAIVKLLDKAMATSGNYRNFYVKDGVKYAHTIDPHTGYPVEHTLLSATVFSTTCMLADAYATSFMVMGVENAMKVLDNHPELDAFLIYSNEQGQLVNYISPGIAPFIEIKNTK